jgi:hypothetical protein
MAPPAKRFLSAEVCCDQVNGLILSNFIWKFGLDFELIRLNALTEGPCTAP